MFDGPNIVLKLHIGRVYTLQDIAIFIFGPFGLKLHIHTPLGEFFLLGGEYSGVKFSGIPLDPRSGTFVLGSGRLCLEIRHLRWEIHHLKIENVGF